MAHYTNRNIALRSCDVAVGIQAGSPPETLSWYDVFAVTVAIVAKCVDGKHLGGRGAVVPGEALDWQL